MVSTYDLFDFKFDCKRPVGKNKRGIEVVVFEKVITGLCVQSRGGGKDVKYLFCRDCFELFGVLFLVKNWQNITEEAGRWSWRAEDEISSLRS